MLLGPTGTGKSALAVEVAERLGGEIVGCDALQVYRGLDAATAKPSAAERRRVPHHLIDHRDPRQDYTLARFVAEADDAIASIAARGRIPLVAGGTGLYLRGLLRGIVDAPARDSRLRQRIGRLRARFGTPRLHRWLQGLDPRSAARVAAADTHRVTRALELALGGGPSWSERLEQQGNWRGAGERYRALKIGLDVADRERHGAILDARVERFFGEGLVEEVRKLHAAGVPPGANAFRAIGYRQVLQALRTGADPAALVGEVQRSTRRYARKQRSWFRGETGVEWLAAEEPLPMLTAQVVERWREHTDR